MLCALKRSCTFSGSANFASSFEIEDANDSTYVGCSAQVEIHEVFSPFKRGRDKRRRRRASEPARVVVKEYCGNKGRMTSRSTSLFATRYTASRRKGFHVHMPTNVCTSRPRCRSSRSSDAACSYVSRRKGEPPPIWE